MESCRTNELLAEQIGIIQKFALKLSIDDLQQLEAELAETENALNHLKDLMGYLPGR